VLTGRLVVDEAAADGEEEVQRDRHAGEEVLVYERLLLQLLVLSRRERRRPPPAHRVLLRVFPDPAHTNKTQRESKLDVSDRCLQLHARVNRGKRGGKEGRGALRMEEGSLRVGKGGAAEGEEGRGGAVVCCRRQGGKGHRHICLALALSLRSAAAASGRSLLMCCAFAFYLAGSVSFPLSGCACAVLCGGGEEPTTPLDGQGQGRAAGLDGCEVEGERVNGLCVVALLLIGEGWCAMRPTREGCRSYGQAPARIFPVSLSSDISRPLLSLSLRAGRLRLALLTTASGFACCLLFFSLCGLEAARPLMWARGSVAAGRVRGRREPYVVRFASPRFYTAEVNPPRPTTYNAFVAG
jgi:hypothetical protein